MDKRRNDLLTTVSPQAFVLGPLTMAWLARGLWGAFTRFERLTYLGETQDATGVRARRLSRIELVPLVQYRPSDYS